MASRRILRINQLLRHEIAEILQREVQDGALTAPLISITDVDTSPDLRSAKVYFSVYGDEENIKEAEAHLVRAATFIRRNLMDRIDLRQIPRLEFLLDRSIATGGRIMQLMRSIESTGDSQEANADRKE
jgi:ribosome-binding factor A